MEENGAVAVNAVYLCGLTGFLPKGKEASL